MKNYTFTIEGRKVDVIAERSYGATVTLTATCGEHSCSGRVNAFPRGTTKEQAQKNVTDFAEKLAHRCAAQVHNESLLDEIFSEGESK